MESETEAQNDYKIRGLISTFICFLVILLGFTIILCIWPPRLMPFDPYKLASVMYLYDKGACEETSPFQSKRIKNLRLSNDTRGFDVLPFKWQPALVTVSARLSHKTRNYVKLTMYLQGVWASLTIVFKYIITSNRCSRLISIAIKGYFFVFIFFICFDLSMAIVYIMHIKKALTKGMILRHSGWSVELNIKNTDDFAGYLPIIAACCWMRGVVMLALNIYSCKKINDIRFRIKKKLVLTRINLKSQRPFPGPMGEQDSESRTLYYRAGEKKPYVKNFVH